MRAERTVDLGRTLGDAGTDRLPHAPRLRRAARRRVCTPDRRLELRRNCARRWRHPDHGACDARRQRRGTRAAERATPALAAAGRRDDNRDQVRVRTRLSTSERSMLLAARELERTHPVTVATTLLAAHALPPEFAGRADDYIDAHLLGLVTASRRARRQPRANRWSRVSTHSAKTLPSAPTSVTGCSPGLPNSGCRYGCTPSSWQTSAAVASLQGTAALSVDHLEHTSEPDVIALAHAGTVAVLLPVAFYALAETAAATDRAAAPTRRSDRRGERRQSRLRARRVVARSR